MLLRLCYSATAILCFPLFFRFVSACLRSEAGVAVWHTGCLAAFQKTGVGCRELGRNCRWTGCASWHFHRFTCSVTHAAKCRADTEKGWWYWQEMLIQAGVRPEYRQTQTHERWYPGFRTGGLRTTAHIAPLTGHCGGCGCMACCLEMPPTGKQNSGREREQRAEGKHPVIPGRCNAMMDHAVPISNYRFNTHRDTIQPDNTHPEMQPKCNTSLPLNPQLPTLHSICPVVLPAVCTSPFALLWWRLLKKIQNPEFTST